MVYSSRAAWNTSDRQPFSYINYWNRSSVSVKQNIVIDSVVQKLASLNTFRFTLLPPTIPIITPALFN